MSEKQISIFPWLSEGKQLHDSYYVGDNTVYLCVKPTYG